jgi:hypothetical protein
MRTGRVYAGSRGGPASLRAASGRRQGALDADFLAEPGVIRGETLTYREALVAAGLVEV